jgi:hypothetical protein
MDFLKIETVLASMVRKQLGGAAKVANGPVGTLSFSRTKIHVNVHVKEFNDFGGITADGAHIARRHLSKPPDLSGYAEERNGRIVGEIIVAAPNHSTPARLCGILAPEVHSTLNRLKSIQLGQSADKNSSLIFSDFTAYLNRVSSERVISRKAYHAGIIEFYLDGFLHVKVLRKK